MNAAAQRRLTPMCATAVAVFGIVFLSLLFGVGRSVEWDPPRVTPPLPTLHSVSLPSPPLLQTYSQVWEHPLFSSDRKPMVSSGAGAGVSIGDLQLTGVIITPSLRMALLGSAHGHDNKDDASQDVRVREGAMLPDSSWKLIRVLPRSAIFASSSGRTELKLPAGAPIDQMNSGNANQAIPMGGRQGGGVVPGPMMQPAAPGTGMQQPNDAQSQRLLKLRAAILKQRSQQPSGNAQGEH